MQQLLFIEGIRIDNIDTHGALECVVGFMRAPKAGLPKVVFFANVHSVHLARRDQSLLRRINAADLVLPDGSGLALAGRLFGHPIRENVNGTDFMPRVLSYAQREGWSVFLVGGRQEIVDRCARTLVERLPGLRIAGAWHGHCTTQEEESLIAHINGVRPDLLLVGMGTPTQENWIAQQAPGLDVRICFGVGGLFDFLAGDKPRAPVWLRRAGLEWVFRFLHDPAGKWNRVMVEIPAFVARMFAARIMNRALLTRAAHAHNDIGRM